jgi:hypothetical protein
MNTDEEIPERSFGPVRCRFAAGNYQTVRYLDG